MAARTPGLTRRDLLADALLLVSAASLPACNTSDEGARAAGIDAHGLVSTRPRPGEPGWPTPQQWAELAVDVDQHLMTPAPLLAPCAAAPHSAACRDLLANLRNPYFLGDQPSGTQVSGWLDAWRPQASAFAVLAHTASDVAAAVSFAARHQLRLVVKGGGHSYQGTSNAADSLLIWTHPLRDIELHDAFVAAGTHAAPVPAVSVGAGALWMDVYDAVTTRAGRYVQGGGCATVGVAGLIHSGGFGSFSKCFGLAAANLLEAQVVTADGHIHIANAASEPELFWALKGGGGGSFGVITRLTLETFALPAEFGSMSFTVQAASEAAFARLIERFLAFTAGALLNPHWGESVQMRPANQLAISMVCQGLTQAQIASTWAPFLRWLEAHHQEMSVLGEPAFGTRPAQSWWDAQLRREQGSSALVFDGRPHAEPAHAWWAGDQEQVSAYLHGYDSLWLPRRLLRPAARRALAAALTSASRYLPVSLHFNKGLAGARAQVRARALGTAIHPQVIDAFALAIVAAGGPPPLPELGKTIDLAAARANAREVDVAMAALRAVAPGAGSYLAESNYFNAAWARDFWGPNHSRLNRIKRQYDPTGLFTVHHGVGSEAWSDDGFTRRTP